MRWILLKYVVKRKFRDKFNDLKLYHKGDTFETDSEKRAESLINGGFLSSAEMDGTENNEPPEKEGTENNDPSILDQNVGPVKEAITAEMDVEQLNNLLEEEKQGGERKSVIDHIEELLNEKSQQEQE